MDTDDGSLWNVAAVLRAACFWAKVVPSVGGGLLVELPSFENRDCSSFIWLGERATVAGELVAAGFLDGPMPRDGTETPAALKRLSEPWFKRPVELAFPAAVLVGGGTGETGDTS
jgi:hypothetical protein